MRKKSRRAKKDERDTADSTVLSVVSYEAEGFLNDLALLYNIS